MTLSVMSAYITDRVAPLPKNKNKSQIWMRGHKLLGFACSKCQRTFTGTNRSNIYKSCMGHIHKSKACNKAHSLELSLVMGHNGNMVGGAGAAAHPHQTQGMLLFSHNYT